jgi:hypothetical protein
LVAEYADKVSRENGAIGVVIGYDRVGTLGRHDLTSSRKSGTDWSGQIFRMAEP